MLQLTEADLGFPPGGGRAGVIVWREAVRPRWRPWCLAWPDLVLVAPRFLWPPSCVPEPKKIEGWGRAGTRLVWPCAKLAGVGGRPDMLHRLIVQPRVPVPDLAPARALSRARLERCRRSSLAGFRTSLGLDLSCPSRAVAVLERATERRVRDLDVRWGGRALPGAILVYSWGELRAVVSARPRGAAVLRYRKTGALPSPASDSGEGTCPSSSPSSPAARSR